MVAIVVGVSDQAVVEDLFDTELKGVLLLGLVFSPLGAWLRFWLSKRNKSLEETVTVSGIIPGELKGGNGTYVKNTKHRYKNRATGAKIYFEDTSKTWRLSVLGRTCGDEHDFEFGDTDCAAHRAGSLPTGATMLWRATKTAATCSAIAVERFVPVWTMAANLSGTFISVTCWVLAHPLKAESDDSPMLLRPRIWVLAVGSAFCGSLSTASTFANELHRLAPDGAESRTALVYAARSVLGAQAICWAILLPYLSLS
jgi:fluoride ion exporter CrcB/FEX